MGLSMSYGASADGATSSYVSPRIYKGLAMECWHTGYGLGALSVKPVDTLRPRGHGGGAPAGPPEKSRNKAKNRAKCC